MKFLVPNYSCLQNPWLGGYRPQIPVLSVLNWICWNPPSHRTKFLGTPLMTCIHVFINLAIKSRQNPIWTLINIFTVFTHYWNTAMERYTVTFQITNFILTNFLIFTLYQPRISFLSISSKQWTNYSRMSLHVPKKDKNQLTGKNGCYNQVRVNIMKTNMITMSTIK